MAIFGTRSTKPSNNQINVWGQGSGPSHLLDRISVVHCVFLSSYLEAILSRECRIYGVAPGVAVAPDDTTVSGDEPFVRRDIEDPVEAPGGATAFQAL